MNGLVDMDAYDSIISVAANAQQLPHPPWSFTAVNTPFPRQSTVSGSFLPEGDGAGAFAADTEWPDIALAAAMEPGDERRVLNSTSVMSVNWFTPFFHVCDLRVRGGRAKTQSQ
jgi:hypothetical protein